MSSSTIRDTSYLIIVSKLCSFSNLNVKKALTQHKKSHSFDSSYSLSTSAFLIHLLFNLYDLSFLLTKKKPQLPPGLLFL